MPLAPVPGTHAELRARLEAAGVAPDQIASILLEPSGTLGVTSGHPPPLYSPSTIKYELSKTHSETTPAGDRFTYAIHSSGFPISQPTWTCVFCSALDPQLRIFRAVDEFGRDAAKTEICSASYRRDRVWISYAWLDWRSYWNPEDSVWWSDTGIMDTGRPKGRDTLQWRYGKEDAETKEIVVRCVTTGGREEKGSVSNVPEGTELCRAINARRPDGRADVELSGEHFAGASMQQLDEMVALAIIQVFRHGWGWSNAAQKSAASSASNQPLAAPSNTSDEPSMTTLEKLTVASSLAEIASSVNSILS